MKKAQITIFAIIGLVLLIILGFVLFVVKEMNQPQEIEVVNDETTLFVKSCADGLLSEAVTIVSLQGGYIYTPEPYATFEGFNVPVFDGGVTPVSSIEENIGLYIDEYIVDCLEQSGFEGFDLEQFSDFKTETVVGESSVSIKSSFIYEDFQKEFSSKIDSSFGELLQIAKKIIDIRNSPSWSYLQIQLLKSEYDIVIE
ncbi:MAG: hypothetical protein KKF89_02295, partial [Nanoarchaeota archaeon]|nr:hypothetical protein [Nanoarchaeota archaeon]